MIAAPVVNVKFRLQLEILWLYSFLSSFLAPLAALAALRQKDPEAPVSADYYHGTTRQERRETLAAELEEKVPRHPRNRLLSLLQQAIQWQAHTGLLPEVKERYHADDVEAVTENDAVRPKKRPLRHT